MAKKKYTRVERADQLIPKLREAGVGLHVLPTALALYDHADNSTGVAYPSIERLASILGVCRRTVERHVKLLSDAGIILKSSQRRQWHHRQRRHRGRWGTCRYCVVAVMFFPERHASRTASNSRTQTVGQSPHTPPKKARRRNLKNSDPPSTSVEDFKEGYEWFFR